LRGGMQTVVKPLGRAFRAVPGIAGSTVLGDGRIGLILDVPSLLRGVMQSTLQAQA
jgi:two-component system chemotaxis sensor kinase CheA